MCVCLCVSVSVSVCACSCLSVCLAVPPLRSYLAQESYIGKNRLCRTFAITKVDRLAVIPLAILVQINQKLEYILLAGCTSVTQFRIIIAVDRIHVRTDNDNIWQLELSFHVTPRFVLIERLNWLIDTINWLRLRLIIID